jgi:peroxiredoxin
MATSRLAPLSLAAAAAVAALAACATSSPRAAAAPLRLAAPDGTSTTVAELAAAREATVLVFWSATCPCVRRYQARTDALLDDWPAARVRVVGVSSNAGERYDEVLRAAAERGVRVPILRDEGGRLAEALGVRSTPTVVVLDARAEVRYLGWIDNERGRGDPGREPWLDRALAGVLDGSPYAARSPTYGCAITRSLFGAKSSPCCTAH